MIDWPLGVTEEQLQEPMRPPFARAREIKERKEGRIEALNRYLVTRGLNLEKRARVEYCEGCGCDTEY